MISKFSQKVYLTNTSSVCCAGHNNEELFNNICESKSGISQISNYFQDLSPSVGLINSDESFYQLLNKQIEEILNNNIMNLYACDLLHKFK